MVQGVLRDVNHQTEDAYKVILKIATKIFINIDWFIHYLRAF
jgi:hypothetical protein